MPSASNIYLLCACYFLDSWSSVAFGQGSYPKPSLQVNPGNVTVRGGQLTFTCTGAHSGVRFVLYKDGNLVNYQDPPGQEAVFLITDVKQEHEGTYTCRYQTLSGPYISSDLSDPIQIRVRGSYPKPTLQVNPGNVIVRGGNLTITCTGAYSGVRFALYKGTNILHYQDPPGQEAVFLITDVKQEDEGTYTCRYHPLSGPVIYSDLSDRIQIEVRDFTQGNILRAVLSAVVVISLLIILTEHCYSSKKNGKSEQERSTE